MNFSCFSQIRAVALQHGQHPTFLDHRSWTPFKCNFQQKPSRINCASCGNFQTFDHNIEMIIL